MHQTLLARFFDHLRQRPGVDVELEQESVLWAPLEGGERAGTRIGFVVPQDELANLISQRERVASELWPDVSPEVAGFRLLYTRMMELAESDRSMGSTRFILRDGDFSPIPLTS
jgi:hypothetical protein